MKKNQDIRWARVISCLGLAMLIVGALGAVRATSMVPMPFQEPDECPTCDPETIIDIGVFRFLARPSFGVEENLEHPIHPGYGGLELIFTNLWMPSATGLAQTDSDGEESLDVEVCIAFSVPEDNFLRPQEPQNYQFWNIGGNNDEIHWLGEAQNAFSYMSNADLFLVRDIILWNTTGTQVPHKSISDITFNKGIISF